MQLDVKTNTPVHLDATFTPSHDTDLSELKVRSGITMATFNNIKARKYEDHRLSSNLDREKVNQESSQEDHYNSGKAADIHSSGGNICCKE